MRTMQFIKDYLKGEARITISNTKGSIWYEGDAMSLPCEIVKGTKIANISGLGSQQDIIIEVEATEESAG